MSESCQNPMPFSCNWISRRRNNCFCKNFQNWCICFTCVLAIGYKLSAAYQFYSSPEICINSYKSLSFPNTQELGVRDSVGVTLCVMYTTKHYMKGILKEAELTTLKLGNPSIKVALITWLHSIFRWNPHWVAIHFIFLSRFLCVRSVYVFAQSPKPILMRDERPHFSLTSHFNVVFVKHKWLLVFTMSQTCKKVLISLHSWGPEVWRGSTMKQPGIWVHNLMSCTCFFCIAAFAYMHLKHNCKRVLSDRHSWNKNPKHQEVSHLEMVAMPGNARSHNLPTITQELHSSREALALECHLTSWKIKSTSPQSDISINLNNMWSSLLYTLLIPPKSWLTLCDEWDGAMIKKKIEITLCDNV